MSEIRNNSPASTSSGRTKAKYRSRSNKSHSRRNTSRSRTILIVVTGSASVLAIVSLLPRFLPEILGLILGFSSVPSSTAKPTVEVRAPVAVAPSGTAIVKAGAGNHSGNSGNNSGNDQSVSVSGSVGDGTVINTGDGDIDNRRISFHGDVNDKAMKTLLRPTKLTSQQFITRYIDAAAERMPDRPSVALHVLEVAGFEATGIQDAAGAALMNLGYHVPTLFRAPFADDGLDKELFRGSAKLADQLQLRRHCDGVLLGEVQIKAANNLQGLFITEASLSLHQIAVDSGAVARNIVIRAKGTGLNADASAASALRELEESIKQQLGEWTLT